MCLCRALRDNETQMLMRSSLLVWLYLQFPALDEIICLLVFFSALTSEEPWLFKMHPQILMPEYGFQFLWRCKVSSNSTKITLKGIDLQGGLFYIISSFKGRRDLFWKDKIVIWEFELCIVCKLRLDLDN